MTRMLTAAWEQQQQGQEQGDKAEVQVALAAAARACAHLACPNMRGSSEARFAGSAVLALQDQVLRAGLPARRLAAAPAGVQAAGGAAGVSSAEGWTGLCGELVACACILHFGAASARCS